MYRFKKHQAPKIFNIVFEKSTHKYPNKFLGTNFKDQKYYLIVLVQNIQFL